MEKAGVEPDRMDAERRVINIGGMYNLRDLGGLPQHGGGGTLRRALLYRSGDLAGLPPESVAALEGLGIRTIVDFRDAEERRQHPDTEFSTLRMIVSLPLRTGTIIDFFNVHSIEEADSLMKIMYRRLPEAAVFPYRTLFRILQNQENLPLLFHCAAGKDRTGLAAALILHALGCGQETIIADYMLSEECLKGKYDADIAAHPTVEPFMTVRRDYIIQALDAIEHEMGGMDHYLRETLGVETALLQKMYTYGRN